MISLQRKITESPADHGEVYTNGIIMAVLAVPLSLLFLASAGVQSYMTILIPLIIIFSVNFGQSAGAKTFMDTLFKDDLETGREKLAEANSDGNLFQRLYGKVIDSKLGVVIFWAMFLTGLFSSGNIFGGIAFIVMVFAFMSIGVLFIYKRNDDRVAFIKTYFEEKYVELGLLNNSYIPENWKAPSRKSKKDKSKE